MFKDKLMILTFFLPDEDRRKDDRVQRLPRAQRCATSVAEGDIYIHHNVPIKVDVVRLMGFFPSI